MYSYLLSINLCVRACLRGKIKIKQRMGLLQLAPIRIVQFCFQASSAIWSDWFEFQNALCQNNQVSRVFYILFSTINTHPFEAIVIGTKKLSPLVSEMSVEILLACEWACNRHQWKIIILWIIWNRVFMLTECFDFIYCLFVCVSVLPSFLRLFSQEIIP